FSGDQHLLVPAFFMTVHEQRPAPSFRPTVGPPAVMTSAKKSAQTHALNRCPSQQTLVPENGRQTVSLDLL
ncbi:MAG TPA: hypothetical protein PLN63_07340, partial [Paludibacteraceae bacterium]|nr:hypothetical protein [Paludibacteraceae bacterium]HPH63416.1 hypothetical protein [Paludibacteraceae bacterium]